jgi:hypothetical protein
MARRHRVSADLLEEQVQDPAGGVRDDGAGTEDGGGALLI